MFQIDCFPLPQAQKVWHLRYGLGVRLLPKGLCPMLFQISFSATFGVAERKLSQVWSGTMPQGTQVRDPA